MSDNTGKTCKECGRPIRYGQPVVLVHEWQRGHVPVLATLGSIHRECLEGGVVE